MSDNIIEPGLKIVSITESPVYHKFGWFKRNPFTGEPMPSPVPDWGRQIDIIVDYEDNNKGKHTIHNPTIEETLYLLGNNESPSKQINFWLVEHLRTLLKGEGTAVTGMSRTSEEGVSL